MNLGKAPLLLPWMLLGTGIGAAGESFLDPPEGPLEGKTHPMSGIALNEDNSHFFYSRSPHQMTAEGVDAWVDTYLDTQVRELMLCTTCMRTNVPSQARQTIFDGFDPAADNDQPFFAGVAPEDRAGLRRWVYNAWLLHQRGIDPYARWIAKNRAGGLSPWISVRMNDVHNVHEPEHVLHDRFWKEHPEYRRVPWRFSSWPDRAFDYGRPEVRAYQMAYLREIIGRYDLDGLELDWMRFGYHFRPGFEGEGAVLLTEFTAEVRRLLQDREKELGHPIKLGARVPSRPDTARRLGMDAVAWARQGLLDFLVVTPFWATIETDMPIELWKQLLEGTGVTLAAGLEVLLRPYPGAAPQTNDLATVRGAASSYLDRGADRIYLFNYMDSDTTIASKEEYHQLLREVGSLDTMAGKPRRHVVTYADTWAPGEPQALPLPRSLGPGGLAEFRLPTGPAPLSGQPVQVCLGLAGTAPLAPEDLQVRVNGDWCAYAGKPALGQVGPTHAFKVPAGMLRRGDNVIEVVNATAAEKQIVWVEVALGAAPELGTANR